MIRKRMKKVPLELYFETTGTIGFYEQMTVEPKPIGDNLAHPISPNLIIYAHWEEGQHYRCKLDKYMFD